jgi:predicted nicotinamide N-methyase
LFSLDSFHSEYDTDIREITINGKRFRFLVPDSIERFIDFEDPLHAFPLWVKIWHAGVVLAGHLNSMPVEPGKKFLEIGSGLGVIGIVAAGAGHDVTITDYNADALNFARANMHLNNCRHVTVEKLDWTKPDLEGHFDYIVGSEVIYRDEDIPLLLQLIQQYLSPGGKVLLVEEMRKTVTEFCRQMDHYYDITVRKNRLRSDSEESLILLIELTPKSI